MKFRLAVFILCLAATFSLARAEDGDRLWLRYEPMADAAVQKEYARACAKISLVTPTGMDSATIAAAREELVAGLSGMLGIEPDIVLKQDVRDAALGDEGYGLQFVDGGNVTITANGDTGILYGAFEFLRLVQTRQRLANAVSVPKIQRRILNHWDNLNGFIERGYAGFSLWNWFQLPDYVDPRYRDYARACASVGINGAVLTNVNADSLVLTEAYLTKVAALADALRPYGVRVYLTARFSAPVEIGKLKTADPLDPAVSEWWRAKVAEIYQHVPDFGGFVVKANSEGQPGPQNYGRTHADGANMLADALASHGGIVMWRAFVYESKPGGDRVKQAYEEFAPLDRKFRSNVAVQIKNGPLDFMPREPFHPLFGAMPHTPLAMEFQITQEYLGGSVHLAYLAPMWKEVLDSDTYAQGKGSTVGRVIDGSLDQHRLSVIAGVANTGNDRNWTSHPLAAANWYAFGRLAWDHSLSSDRIAGEWVRMTLSNEGSVVNTVVPMLLNSRETYVDYTMPLGLHHIVAWGHHYGPGPWVMGGSESREEGRQGWAAREDWTSPYYHKADERGLGFNRSSTGSNATAQYAPEVGNMFSDPARCPEKLILWFHHVGWDARMQSGRPLWDELCWHYQHGVEEVRAMQRAWDTLRGKIDQERYDRVRVLLARQEREARGWRDACLLYFQTFSKRPIPSFVESAEHSLEYYKSIDLRWMPGDPGGR